MKKHIAYVCADAGIPVFGTKGASIHVQSVVRAALKAGHRVTLFATRFDGHVPPGLENVACVHLPEIPQGDPTKRAHAALEARDHIAERLDAHAPYDMVYERYSLWSDVGMRWAREHGIPGILEVNAPLIEEQRTHRVLVDEEAAGKALARQVAAATATVAVSDPVRDWVRERTGSESVHTVPNGVSITRIVPRPEDIGDPVVTFVGTLKPWHGVADLLAAAALAKRPWKLRIIGDGPERAALEEQAAGLARRGLHRPSGHRAAVHRAGSRHHRRGPRRPAGWVAGHRLRGRAARRIRHRSGPLPRSRRRTAAVLLALEGLRVPGGRAAGGGLRRRAAAADPR